MPSFIDFFSKKKKTAIAVSEPKSATKSSGYEKVLGASWDLPNVPYFVQQTGGSKDRPTKLQLIDRYLGQYADKNRSHADETAILGQLYFLSDFWLKHDGTRTSPREQKVVKTLFVTVVDQLCQRFDCPVNVLPQMLEEHWGRALTPHGHKIDNQAIAKGGTPKVAKYMARKDLERYRVIFVNGLAYQWNWFESDEPTHLVKANTSQVGWTYHPDIKENMFNPGYAGFALSMGRELYIAHHRGGFHLDNVFHSSYLAGDAALCTGSIHIVDGVVKAIKNDSGHYQPTADHLLNVVETLEMHGVDPQSFTVSAVKGSYLDENGYPANRPAKETGDKIIEKRGGGAGLLGRAANNSWNIRCRGGSMGNIFGFK